MQNKYAGIAGYRAKIHVKEVTNGKIHEEEYEVVFKKPDRFRIDTNNTMMVSNGEKLWFYNKNKNEVKVQRINSTESPDLFYGSLLNMLKDYNIEILKEESVNGKDCYVLNLTANYSDFRENQLRKIWVAKHDWYPVRVEMKIEFRVPEEVQIQTGLKNRSSILVLEYSDFEFNSVRDEEFEFEIPEGVRVVILSVPLPYFEGYRWGYEFL